MCVSEKATISVALKMLDRLKNQQLFWYHLIGTLPMNVVAHVLNEKHTPLSNKHNNSCES